MADESQNYAYVNDLAKSVPEIQAILNEATKNKWDPQHFLDTLYTTNWWRQNSDTAKQAIELEKVDPAEYSRQMNAAKAHVTQMAASLGVTLSAAQIASQATMAMWQGLDDATLQSQIGALYKSGANGATAGTAVSVQEQLQQMAASYGVPVTQSWIDGQIRSSLETGNNTDAAKQALENMAISAYPTLAAQIKGGQTVEQIAQPYVAQMAQTLELNPDAITLQDRTIQAALRGQMTSPSGVSPKLLQTNVNPGTTQQPKTGGSGSGGAGAGAQAPQMPNLFDFTNQLRQDPRWNQTQNARDTAYQMLGQLGKAWGFEA